MVCFVRPLCAFLFYCPFTILTTRGTTNALSSFKRFAGDGNTTPRAADKRVIKHHCSAREVQLHLRKQFWHTGARQTRIWKQAFVQTYHAVWSNCNADYPDWGFMTTLTEVSWLPWLRFYDYPDWGFMTTLTEVLWLPWLRFHD